jgi:uncharacterized membrane protein YedE/YeeE
MARSKASGNWIGLSLIGIIIIAATAVAAVATKLWVLTALPAGFLFGFFLQKGDLCGASAFSEVIIMKDGRKIFGLWAAIVVSMLAFAVGDRMGLVQLAPKPMIWLNYIVGGVIFGVGSVLAGGCVSGCLYKSATGNVNSIAALAAMPFGIGLVEYGPLHGWFESMTSKKIAAADGGPVTLSSLTGLSFTTLAVGFAALTLAAVAIAWARNKPKKKPAGNERAKPPSLKRALTQPWKPWQAGLAIGALALFAYISSDMSGRNYPLGVTHGVLQAQILLTDTPAKFVYKKAAAAPTAAAQAAPKKSEAPQDKKVVWWLVLVVLGMLPGAFIAGALSGQARLLPKPPEQIVGAIFGGFMVGAGAALATGCVIGNIMSGWALMSAGVFLFGIVVILSNWIATYFYLMGGGINLGRR